MRTGNPESEIALQDRLRDRFRRCLAIPAGTEENLAAALEESVARTGNFIRAQLAYAIAVSHGAHDSDALDLAIALEYFHTASLLFDDLPSMDDAMLRRGAPCLHLMFGEGTAILAALALINRAYGMLWRVVARTDSGSSTKALDYVERYLGLGGLLNGQSHDIHYARRPQNERSAQQVAKGKTVGLIRLALVLPAIVNGADEDALGLLDHLAVFWGLAYQTIDDIKDVLHAPELTGKTTARDTALDRPNLVIARGLDAALWSLRKQVRYGEQIVLRLRQSDRRYDCLEAAAKRLAREAARLTPADAEAVA